MIRYLGLSKTYALGVLKKCLQLKKYLSHWVPSAQNDDQKVARVEMASSVLNILEPLTARARSWTLTRDESWFYFAYDCAGK
jgi:hypothetical protein